MHKKAKQPTQQQNNNNNKTFQDFFDRYGICEAKNDG
jgi:hypothetical protein